MRKIKRSKFSSNVMPASAGISCVNKKIPALAGITNFAY